MIGSTIYFICALVVLAEALNKLERVDPVRCAGTARERAAEWLKVIAWTALALGSGGAIVSPFVPNSGDPRIVEFLVMGGFAALIVRTRVKEG